MPLRPAGRHADRRCPRSRSGTCRCGPCSSRRSTSRPASRSCVERCEAADRGALVAEHPVVVRVLAGEQGRPRGTAQRPDREVRREGRAAARRSCCSRQRHEPHRSWVWSSLSSRTMLGRSCASRRGGREGRLPARQQMTRRRPAPRQRDRRSCGPPSLLDQIESASVVPLPLPEKDRLRREGGPGRSSRRPGMGNRQSEVQGMCKARALVVLATGVLLAIAIASVRQLLQQFLGWHDHPRHDRSADLLRPGRRLRPALLRRHLLDVPEPPDRRLRAATRRCPTPPRVATSPTRQTQVFECTLKAGP